MPPVTIATRSTWHDEGATERSPPGAVTASPDVSDGKKRKGDCEKVMADPLRQGKVNAG